MTAVPDWSTLQASYNRLVVFKTLQSDTCSGMQREAQRAAEKVAQLKTAQAEVAARMSADRELLASPDLLQNHPELEFERIASQGALPLLGAAQRLLKSLQLTLGTQHVLLQTVPFKTNVHFPQKY